jgi:hypothetical protein
MYHEMTKGLLTTLGVLSVVGAVLCPVASYANELDSQLDCKSSAHTFIASLINDGYVEPKPMRVEANSVNAFRPTHGSDLTAFGFRVHAIFGYERDDEMFKKGSGKAVADSLYGVVVLGSAESVMMRLRQAGSVAVVHEVLPLVLTAVICNEH